MIQMVRYKFIINYDSPPAVPRKWFGSAYFYTVYTIYLSLFKLTAYPNHFRGTHCMRKPKLHEKISFLIIIIIVYLGDGVIDESELW